MFKASGQETSAFGSMKSVWNEASNFGGKGIKWGVAKHLQNLSSIPREKFSYRQEDPRYQPERTPSNEVLSRDIGSKGKGDATSSAETGQKGVR